MLPVRSRGMPGRVVRLQTVAQHRLPDVLFCAGRSTKVKPTSCRPAVTLMRGDIMRLSTSSREMVMFLPLDS